MIDEVKASGKDKEYDCILGLSGVSDSCYMLHLAVTEWGLRPFVFHIGCRMEFTSGRRQLFKKLCANWVLIYISKNWIGSDMRQMQVAFFKTGHAGLDAPQDHAFIAQIDNYSQNLA